MMTTKSKSDQVPISTLPISERTNRLKKCFYQEFNNEPLFFVRVPGRVNLIGEHIDYCGYPVLPMALEQDILIAAGLINKPQLHLRNVNRKYKDYDCEIKSSKEINITTDTNGKPYWYNYVLCGIKGGLEYIDDKIENGLQLFVDGNIPPASGLSSSSALVSAACLAFLHAQNTSLSKTEIASLCAKSERYIGTQGGGMDQAIAFLAEKFSAQYITWQPLNATSIALPENAAFVVAHSLAEANKAATNDFNRRVIECRLAAKVIAACATAVTDNKIITLRQVQNILGKTLDEMVKLVLEYLPKDIYTKSEICKILNIDDIDLENTYLTQNTKHLKEFKLKQRALHVYEEAIRVEDFRKKCLQAINRNGTNGMDGVNEANGVIYENRECGDIIKTLGDLISGSHESLKNMYECSHDNLDRLIEISKEMNVHARLTGAGWGGCIIAICSKGDVDKYIDLLIEKFYVQNSNIDKNKAASYVFATTPNHGAEIYCINS